MTNENMTSGFDLSYPLISSPQQTQHSQTARVETKPHEQMTSGFDLSWPLLSRPPEDVQEVGTDTQKAA